MSFSSYVLALNELSYEKFAHLTLMKLTAGVNFTNTLLVPFSNKSALQSLESFFSLITVWLCNFLVKEYWCKSCL